MHPASATYTPTSVREGTRRDAAHDQDTTASDKAWPCSKHIMGFLVCSQGLAYINYSRQAFPWHPSICSERFTSISSRLRDHRSIGAIHMGEAWGHQPFQQDDTKISKGIWTRCRVLCIWTYVDNDKH